MKTRSFIFFNIQRSTGKGNYYVDTGTLASSVPEKKIPTENIWVNPTNDKKDKLTNPEGNKPCKWVVMWPV